MSRLRAAGLLVCLVSLNAAAAEAPQHADAGLQSAPVVVDGVALFRVAGAATFPAQERADQIAARIVAAAADPIVQPEDVAVRPREGRIDVVAGEQHIVAVVDSDTAIENLSASDLAQIRATRVREAIVRYRAERHADELLRDLGWTIAIVVAGVIALLLILRVFGRLFDAIERRYHNRVRSLTIQSFEVVRAETLWRGVNGVLSFLRLALIAALIYTCLYAALVRFPATRGFAASLARVITEPLAAAGLAVLHYIPKLAFLVVLVLAVRYLLKILRLFFDGVSAGRVPLRNFDADWAQPTYHIIRILTVLLALVVAYPYLPGSGSAAFQGLSIFAGLMLSLGASSAMASVIAGYTVTYRRAFRVGDRISVGEFTGEVTAVRLMVTHLRTAKNEEIIVPNSLVLQSHVVNYSKLASSDGLILHTTVSIGYETPWRQVEAMLVLAAERTEGMLRQPRPFVLEKGLGDFAVTYELNVYVDSARDIPRRYAALHRNVLDVFNEHGVQIMTPAYEGDPAEPKMVPKEKWFLSPARAAHESQNEKVANAIAPP